MNVYIALLIAAVILHILLEKRYIGISIVSILILWCLFRYIASLNFVESVLLTLFAGTVAFVSYLISWRVKHPRYIITSTFLFMCISILIYIHIMVASSAYFVSASLGDINYLKCVIEGAHFAINTMITGSFDRNNNALPYAIMEYLKTCKTVLPYYTTAVCVSIAPLSALGWFISLFDTDVFLHIGLVWFGQLNKKMYVFADASERSVLLAKEINKKYKENKKAMKSKPLYCFCRCGKNLNNVQAEMLSEIAYLRGAMLTKSETDYRFTPKNTTYFYCDNNHYSLYKSLENLNEQEWNQISNDYRDVYLITDDELQNTSQMLKNGGGRKDKSNIKLYNISVWKIMTDTIINEITSDRVRTLFITGKGRILSMFVRQLNEYCKPMGDEKSIDEAFVFPTTTEDYIDLTTEIELVNEMKIINPSDYIAETIEIEMSSYLKTYNAESMRGVAFLGEDSLENIKKKRRMADIAKQHIEENKLNIYLYCNDGLAISEDADGSTESNAIKYYGLDEKVIPDVAKKILFDGASREKPIFN